MQFTAPPLSLLAPVYFSTVKDEVGSRMEMLRGVSLLVGSLGTTGPGGTTTGKYHAASFFSLCPPR